MITEKEEWVQQNWIYVENFSSEHQSLSLLQNYCDELIIKNPTLFLRSNDLETIEKSEFLTILKSDFLEFEEIEIWDHVV